MGAVFRYTNTKCTPSHKRTKLSSKRVQRAWIVAALFAVVAAVPVATGRLTGAVDRDMLEDSLQNVLTTASQRYRVSTGLRARQREARMPPRKVLQRW